MEERSSERTFHGTYFVECFLLLWFEISCSVMDYVEMSLLISVKKQGIIIIINIIVSIDILIHY